MGTLYRIAVYAEVPKMSLTRPISPDLDAWVDNDPELARQLRHSLNASIGASLRVARTHAGMSQAEVATAMWASRGHASHRSRGRRVRLYRSVSWLGTLLPWAAGPTSCS